MITPTLSGMVAQPLKILTLADTDTVTPQEHIDGMYGAAVIGAAVKTWRDDSVVRNTLGQAALDRVREQRIFKFI